MLLLLAVEVLLWLSDRFGWLGWHKGYAVLTGVAVVGVAMLLMLVWFAVALVFRRRFQFSIRSLLVLVVVVALPCSWLAAEMKKAKEQEKLVEAIRNLKKSLPYYTASCVTYDYELDSECDLLPDPQPREPMWLRNLLGMTSLSKLQLWTWRVL